MMAGGITSTKVTVPVPDRRCTTLELSPTPLTRSACSARSTWIVPRSRAWGILLWKGWDQGQFWGETTGLWDLGLGLNFGTLVL
jgi:hypothetical protein